MRLVCTIAVLTAAAAGCTFNDRGAGGSVNGTGGQGGLITSRGTGGAVQAGPCMGLQCQQTTCKIGNCIATACAPGTSTNVTGTVYAPEGTIPLYNAYVYVPNTALADIPEGASCDRCDTALSGSPVTQATTDAAGAFVLQNVPVGDNIPLVIQIGKWRRQTTIANVPSCVTTTITDHEVTRLARNQTEGHIPKIALTTGGLDALECLLRKIGIEDSEFTPEAGTGRVNLFSGGTHNGVPINNQANNNSAGTNSYAPTLNAGAMFTDAETWWSSVDNLLKYDIVLHSCEGTENPTNKPLAAVQAMQAYANAGGRIFASHWHNYWIEHGPAPFPTVARFNHRNDPGANFVATIDTSFAKGQALADWLVNVGASTTPGQLPIAGAKLTVQSVSALAQRWAYNTQANSVQYFSFVTPVSAAADNICGKVVFSDLHVSSGSGAATDDNSDRTLPFPTGCHPTALSPQEKALLFMLFDLSGCLGFEIG